LIGRLRLSGQPLSRKRRISQESAKPLHADAAVVTMAAMPAVYEHHHTVLAEEIDALGHANNLVYLAWMQAAALAHSAVQGWPAQRYHELGSGWVVRSHQIEYLRPAFAGEDIVVRTWVADFRKVSSLRRYKIIRPSGDRLLATAATDWVFVNYGTGLPVRVPPEIVAAFELYAEEKSQ
jgi:acyl-CoA thioester hydrolase